MLAGTHFEKAKPLKKTSRRLVDAAFGGMIGSCPDMLEVFRLISKVAPSDLSVLVIGDTGTGKEMVAESIHQLSDRFNGPFIIVNCGAIPAELVESELFGHEKGAYTGAFRSMIGKVELADGGTLFLDEVGELPLQTQVKLLRFLNDSTFERVGGREIRKVNARFIAATNRNPEKVIKERWFREDFYYRLNGITITLPPLKDRGEDILAIASAMLDEVAREAEKSILGFTPLAEQALLQHFWPGNVRELINCIHRAVVMAEGPRITPENLGLDKATRAKIPEKGKGLREALNSFEAEFLTRALKSVQGNVEETARLLKTSRSVIYHLKKKHGI